MAEYKSNRSVFPIMAIVLLLFAAVELHARQFDHGAAGGMRQVLLHRVAVAILVTTVFALLAARLRFVTVGGAIAGFFVAATIFTFSGAGGFLALATVFVLTLIATRMGYSRKQRLGMQEHHDGRRAMQVLANLSVAAVLSVLAVSTAKSWLFICMAAAMAEAAADTVSSECGEAWSDHVYLVTTFERVAVGTDGGISLAGTAAGIGAAAAVVSVFSAAHLVTRNGAVLAVGAAVIGTFVDSLLGATMERRRWLTNNAVNFLSTLAAATLAAALVNL